MSGHRAGPFRRRRKLRLQLLEPRRLLVAEGGHYELSETIDLAEFPGAFEAEIRWGDGAVSAAEVGARQQGGPLRFRFDYSLDTRGFFAGTNRPRRNLLELAGTAVLSQLTDTLSAITPGGFNEWTPNIRHPSAGEPLNPPLHDLPSSLRVAANEIIVYVGSRDFPGNIRGLGGPGGATTFGTPEFLDRVRSRGEPGALLSRPTDFAPAVGSVSFDVDTSTDWYFGADPAGIGPGQVDFVSVAVHELAHVLGFGIAPSWTRLVNANDRFTGAAARAAYAGSGNVPVSGSHWADGVLSRGDRLPSMGAELHTHNGRQMLTALDYAGLKDMGWEVIDSLVTISGAHRFPDDGGPHDGVYVPELVLHSRIDGELVASQVLQRDPVTVTNVAPTLTVVADQRVTAGRTLSITDIGQITDPGYRNTQGGFDTRESFRYTVDWGDGSPLIAGAATTDGTGNSSGRLTRASFDAQHVYASAGEYTVTVRVTDDDGGADEQSFQVLVTAPPALVLELNRNVISENAGEGAAVLTIRRDGPAQLSGQRIDLVSNDETEAELPDSVIIPAGQTEVDVLVRAIDDALLDGTVAVDLTAMADGLVSDTVQLWVEDHESLIAELAADRIREDSTTGVRLTVGRSNTDDSRPLTVAVGGGNVDQLRHPATITIPAGQPQQSVMLFPVDDEDAEPPTTLTFVLTAAGYTAAETTLVIDDDELPAFQNPQDRFDVTGHDGVRASDALRIVNELFRRAGSSFLDPEVEPHAGVFWDVNGDYRITALDALIVINELPNRDSNGHPTADGQRAPMGILRGGKRDPVLADEAEEEPSWMVNLF